MRKTNMVGWFEIPVTDMDRAKKFYENVFDVEINVMEFGGEMMGFFPFAEDPEAKGAGGALIKKEGLYTPSVDGVLIYFSCKELTKELNRIEAAGGKVLIEKKLISEDVGYMGLFLDSEGNRIALHSRE